VAVTATASAVDAPVVRRTWRAWSGPGAGAVAVCASLAGTWLAAGPGGRSLAGLMHDNVLNNAVEGVVLGAIAGALLRLRPHHRVGWLLMYSAFANAVAILGEGWALATFHTGLPGRTVAAWLASWTWATALLLGATVLPAIYPDGRAADRFARHVVRIAWTASAVVGGCLALLDGPYRDAVPGHHLGHNPISGGRFEVPLVVAAAAAGIVGVATAVATLVWMVRRLRHAVSPQREQLSWLFVSVVPVVVGALLASPPVMFAITLLTSVTLLIGIVRHQLFDIKLILRSGLVYGLLLALAVGGYVGVVELITLVTPSGTISRLFAAAAVALVVVPAYRWLTGAVGRLVYGDRADPVRALGRIGRELGGAQGADLASITGAVAASLRSPYVAVRADDDVVLASTGRPEGNPVHTVPLRHAGADVGRLEVSWRTPADGFTATDRRLLEALAGPVAVAVRAAQLAAEVGESRARVIAVRDRERRELRNDLHDGLGPSLSGVALGIEAALRADDEQRVREILGVVHAEVNGMVREVRHLIDDLGPAGLEHGGLDLALRSHAEAVAAVGGVEVDVDVAPLPALAMPVEVALYRVAGEALTNVVRHAHARHASVVVTASPDAIRLVVEDDGRGLGGAPGGVGRSSMAERIASVGGTFSVVDRAGGGTVLTAVVPLDRGGVDD
jgi:signal transduction histidine kinase